MLSYIINKAKSSKHSRSLYAWLQKHVFCTRNYRLPNVSVKTDQMFDCFVASDGTEFRLSKTYRDTVKSAWSYFQELEAFDYMQKQGVLSREQECFLQEAKGEETLGFSIFQIREHAEQVCRTHGAYFLEDSFIVKPSLEYIEKLLTYSIAQHRKWVYHLHSMGFLPEGLHGKRVLEIGFISGGYSIFALERMGCIASGVDNFYDGAVEDASALPEYLKTKLNSSVEFLPGDISKKTTSIPLEAIINVIF